MAVINGNQLEMKRCPHCGVANPMLLAMTTFQSKGAKGGTKEWICFGCSTCGGVVTTRVGLHTVGIRELFPEITVVDDSIPHPAGEYLSQALESMHTPAGCIMLSASAVDAMLKAKGYKNGDLYTRINEAARDHLITNEMAQWAHEVRLDANDQRHADESNPLPTIEEAKKCVEFVLALGEFLFVLPSRVDRGLASVKNTEANPEPNA